MIFHTKIKSIIDKSLNQTGKERQSGDVKYHCFKCNHHKQKLEVNIDTGEYHCWVCHFRGSNILDLLKGAGASKSYIDEAKEIFKESGKQIKNWDKILKNEEKEETPRLTLPDGFISLTESKKDIHWKKCFQYAIKRNISPIDMLRHNIGYVKNGKMSNRLIVPSYDCEGNLNYYSARSYDDDVYLKYINAQVPNHNIVGFELLVDFKQPINLVEGSLDAITLGYNTIPLFGKNLSVLLKQRIIENKTPEIRVILDDDAFTEALSICEYLLRFDFRVKLIQLNGKDPNVLGRLKTQEIIDQSNFLDFSDIVKFKLK